MPLGGQLRALEQGSGGGHRARRADEDGRDRSPVNGPGVHAEQHGKSLHGRHPEGKRDEQGYAHRRRQARHGPEQDAQRNPGDVGYQRTETQGRFYPSKNLGHRVLLRQHDLKEVSEGIQQRSRGQRRHSYDFNGIPASQKGQGEQQKQERGDRKSAVVRPREPALLHEPVAEPDHAGQVHDEETEKEKGFDDGGSVSPTTAGPVPQQPLEDEENPAQRHAAEGQRGQRVRPDNLPIGRGDGGRHFVSPHRAKA